MLATWERFKARFGNADGDKTGVESLLDAVSADLARYAGRARGGTPCMEKGERVHFFSIRPAAARYLWLPAYPVVSISEISEALYNEWDDATALVEGDDYMLDAGTGRLTRIGAWLPGARTVRVIYTGGYTGPDTFDAAGWMPDAWASGTAYEADDTAFLDGVVYLCTGDVTGSTPPAADADHWERRDVLLPDDVVEACLAQAGFQWNRRSRIGLVGEGGAGGSISHYARDELLPGVKQTMASYRRRMG